MTAGADFSRGVLLLCWRLGGAGVLFLGDAFFPLGVSDVPRGVCFFCFLLSGAVRGYCFCYCWG